MAVDALGRPTVAWSDLDGSSPPAQIYVRRFNGSEWEEVGANSASGEGVSGAEGLLYSFHPSVAIGSDQNPVVSWSIVNQDSSAIDQIHLRRWSGSSWEELGGSATGGGLSSTGDDSQFPSVAVDGEGRPIVAWSAYSRDLRDRVYLRRWNGVEWEELGGSASGAGISPERIEEYPPTLVLDRQGYPIVAWENNYAGVYVRRWNGSSWTDYGEGSSTGEGVSFGMGIGAQPHMAADPMGNPVAVWIDGVGGIFLRTTGPGLHVAGSANADALVDVSDLITLINHLNDSAPLTYQVALDNADLTGDDEITQADADALVDLLLGQ
jgi:hypothetical protein